MTRKCILVTGMHRSGTSALAGALHLVRVDIGTSIIPPNYDNERGFFENKTIHTLNEELLEILQITWDAPVLLTKKWWQQPTIIQFKSKAKKIIQTEFGGQSVFVIKDPRLCYLFPFWEEVLTTMDIEIFCAITVRNAKNVAASLEKRNKFSAIKSHLLYISYLFSIEKYTRTYPRIFVNYDTFLQHYPTILNSIGTVAAIDLSLSKIKAQELAEFLTPPASTPNETKLKNPFLPYQTETYQTFQGLTENPNSTDNLQALHKAHQNFLHSFCRKKGDYTTTLSIDFGEGFQHTAPIEALLDSSTQVWEFEKWKLDKAIHQVKIHPSDSPCFVKITLSKIPTTFSIRSNAYLEEEGIHYFANDNGEVLIKFASPLSPKNLEIRMDYQYVIPTSNFDLQERSKELKILKNSISYRTGWLLTSPFRILYYLLKLLKNSGFKQIFSLVKTALLNPFTFLKKIQPKHFATLRKALTTEPPQVIIKNIIKFITK